MPKTKQSARLTCRFIRGRPSIELMILRCYCCGTPVRERLTI
jgi:hypothetical protein